MLKALQNQLDALAADYDKSFENQITKRWGKKPPPGLVKDLKEFVRLLPKMERRIFSLYAWLPESSRIKKIGSHFLTYMYQPDDFIPEDAKNGLFGYLDDAYLAALFFELMLEEIENSEQLRIKKEDRDFLRRLIRYKKKARAVIPEEAIMLNQMVGELFEGEENIYQGLFEGKIPA